MPQKSPSGSLAGRRRQPPERKPGPGKHQRDADQFPDARFAIEDRIVAEADHVIAECPQEEEDLIRYYNADPARISIVPGGFDPTEFWPIRESTSS